jgi:hypothetical protein
MLESCGFYSLAGYKWSVPDRCRPTSNIFIFQSKMRLIHHWATHSPSHPLSHSWWLCGWKGKWLFLFVCLCSMYVCRYIRPTLGMWSGDCGDGAIKWRGIAWNRRRLGGRDFARFSEFLSVFVLKIVWVLIMSTVPCDAEKVSKDVSWGFSGTEFDMDSSLCGFSDIFDNRNSLNIWSS